jgi:hypothetical protein
MATPAGFQLRLLRGISVSGSTYGSGDYGVGTYGERASDPADLQLYEAVPVDAGLGAGVTMRARVGATPTLSYQIIAFGGPFEDGEGSVLDLSTVSEARLRLDRVSAGQHAVFNYDLTIDTINDKLTRTLNSVDLPLPGTFRLVIVLIFTSGRRMTVPVSDKFMLHVADGEVMT